MGRVCVLAFYRNPIDDKREALKELEINQRAESPESLRPSEPREPQTLRPSDPQTLRPSDPQSPAAAPGLTRITTASSWGSELASWRSFDLLPALVTGKFGDASFDPQPGPCSEGALRFQHSLLQVDTGACRGPFSGLMDSRANWKRLMGEQIPASRLLVWDPSVGGQDKAPPTTPPGRLEPHLRR